jgi:hypothetical protein
MLEKRAFCSSFNFITWHMADNHQFRPVTHGGRATVNGSETRALCICLHAPCFCDGPPGAVPIVFPQKPRLVAVAETGCKQFQVKKRGQGYFAIFQENFLLYIDIYY